MFVPPENEDDIHLIEASGDVFSLGQIFLYIVSKNPNRSFVRSSDWASTCLEELRQRPPGDASPMSVQQFQQLVDLIASAVTDAPEMRPSANTLARSLAEFSGPAEFSDPAELEGVVSAEPRQNRPASTPNSLAALKVPTVKAPAVANSDASTRKRLSKSTWTGIAIASVLALGLFTKFFYFSVPAGDDQLALDAEEHPVAKAIVDTEAKRSPISSTAADTTQARGDRRVRPTLVGDVHKPDLYMLTIGVSQYRDPQYNLSVADSDAQILANTFREGESGIFGKVKIHTLTNDKADKNGILQELKWLQSETTQNDLAIVTVSGHGVTDEFDDFFFCRTITIPARPWHFLPYRGTTFTVGWRECPAIFGWSWTPATVVE